METTKPEKLPTYVPCTYDGCKNNCLRARGLCGQHTEAAFERRRVIMRKKRQRLKEEHQKAQKQQINYREK
jgi:hypothetical protein